jgi:hypothetical protein
VVGPDLVWRVLAVLVGQYRMGGVRPGSAVKDWSDMDRCGKAGCGEDGGCGLRGGD